MSAPGSAQSALPANLQIPSEPLLKGFADYRVERRDAQSPSALRGCRARSLIHRRRGRRRRFARRLLDCRLRRRHRRHRFRALSPQAFRTGKARSKGPGFPPAPPRSKTESASTIASIPASTTRPRPRGGVRLGVPTASGPAMKSRGPTGSGCRHYEILAWPSFGADRSVCLHQRSPGAMPADIFRAVDPHQSFCFFLVCQSCANSAEVPISQRTAVASHLPQHPEFRGPNRNSHAL